MTKQPILVRVSFTDQLDVNSMLRRDVAPPADLPVELVQLRTSANESIGRPTLISMRVVLETSRIGAQIVHQWKVTVSPDHPLMRMRFNSEGGSTRLDDGSALRGMGDYTLMQALEDALRQLSDLRDPEPLNGTTILIHLGYKTDGRIYFRVEADSIAGANRERKTIIKDNEKRCRDAQWRVPFTSIVLYQGEYFEEQVPREHLSDEWRIMHSEPLTQIFLGSIRPCLQSLWRAVFGSGANAEQLRQQGFPIEAIGRDVVAIGDLKKMIAKQNNPDRHTMMFNPAIHSIPEGSS